MSLSINFQKLFYSYVVVALIIIIMLLRTVPTIIVWVVVVLAEWRLPTRVDVDDVLTYIIYLYYYVPVVLIIKIKFMSLRPLFTLAQAARHHSPSAMRLLRMALIAGAWAKLCAVSEGSEMLYNEWCGY